MTRLLAQEFRTPLVDANRQLTGPWQKQLANVRVLTSTDPSLESLNGRVSVSDFGALCDGKTDDTMAVQAAVTFAAANHLVLTISAGKTCIIAASGTSALNADGSNGWRLRSEGGAGALGNYATLKFTGNPSTSLLSVRSSTGVEIDHLNIQYTNGSFAGLGIDTSQSNGSDSSSFHLHDMLLTGTTGSATGAVALIGLDKTNSSVIERSIFRYANSAIRGTAGGDSYSNKIIIGSNTFGSAGISNFPNGVIINYGNAWTISDNTFEIGTGNQSLILGNDIAVTGPNFTGNWAGDPGAYSGTLLANMTSGTNISGNFITVSNGTTGTFLGMANNTNIGLVIKGNYIQNAATLAAFGANTHINVEIIGNALPSITNLYTGNTPSNGRLCDNTGTTKSMIHGLLVYANNAAAITGGLVIGQLYRTGADPDVVCVVH
jgi:hypothetical protein